MSLSCLLGTSIKGFAWLIRAEPPASGWSRQAPQMSPKLLPPLVAAKPPPRDLSQPGLGLPRHASPLPQFPQPPPGSCSQPNTSQLPFGAMKPISTSAFAERGGHAEGRPAPRCPCGMSHWLLLFRSFTQRWEPIATHAAVVSQRRRPQLGPCPFTPCLLLPAPSPCLHVTAKIRQGALSLHV